MTDQQRLQTEIAALKYNSDGLIPAIAQQHDTGEVLMMAWMNAHSIQESLETGRVCYWSRSRQKYWRKGEESGQIQMLKEMRFDCDNDTILLQVDQHGAACHTGRKTCFYKRVHKAQIIIDSEPLVDPKTLYVDSHK
jgi:phosphoribosyl-AMP cyclohydrolase